MLKISTGACLIFNLTRRYDAHYMPLLTKLRLIDMTLGLGMTSLFQSPEKDFLEWILQRTPSMDEPPKSSSVRR